eukprot:1677040-Prymnesium_polylepis.2
MSLPSTPPPGGPARAPTRPNPPMKRRSVPCITCVSEGSVGLLVAQPSSLFAYPASQHGTASNP